MPGGVAESGCHRPASVQAEGDAQRAQPRLCSVCVRKMPGTKPWEQTDGLTNPWRTGRRERMSSLPKTTGEKAAAGKGAPGPCVLPPRA